MGIYFIVGFGFCLWNSVEASTRCIEGLRAHGYQASYAVSFIYMCAFRYLSKQKQKESSDCKEERHNIYFYSAKALEEC